MTKSTVLVADADEKSRRDLTYILASLGYTATSVDSGEKVLKCLETGDAPSIVILDLSLQGISGLAVLEQLHRFRHPPQVIVVSAITDTTTVVKAMKLGALEYLIKPVQKEDIENAIAQHALGAVYGPFSKDGNWWLSSLKPEVLHLLDVSRRAAETDESVLISGESGVGKEVFARFIHAQSSRRDRPFLKINCAAVPAELLESEFFGYERGAFTGARESKPGKFEAASVGTIFLDEIGEINFALQAKLLHVLEDGEYARLGGNRPIPMNARILAATNKRLEEAIQNHEFRLDLFYRLNVIHIELPPLRERREDIPPLCNYFINKYCQKYDCQGRTELPAQLLELFHHYSWPGNIRQLENAVKQYLIFGEVSLDLEKNNSQQIHALGVQASLKTVATEAAEQAEKDIVLRLLEENHWNRKQVARELHTSYRTLLNKLRRWRLSESKPVIAAEHSEIPNESAEDHAPLKKAHSTSKVA